MTVEYSSSRRELASWYWYSLRHNRKHLRAWLLSVVGVGVLVFLSERQSAGSSIPRAIGISGLSILGLALFLALYPQVRFKPQKRTLTIAPDGISTTINARSKTYPWSEVASVVQRGDQVYIGFTNVNAFVVPTRAFPSADSRQEFVRLCREWCEASSDRPAA